jgi:hypothetical protein
MQATAKADTISIPEEYLYADPDWYLYTDPDWNVFDVTNPLYDPGDSFDDDGEELDAVFDAVREYISPQP